jgi:hypothetical protein
MTSHTARTCYRYILKFGPDRLLKTIFCTNLPEFYIDVIVKKTKNCLIYYSPLESALSFNMKKSLQMTFKNDRVSNVVAEA